MADREIRLIISGDGSAAISSIQKVGDETQRLSQRAKISFDQIMSHWKTLAGAMAGYKLLDWGKDLASGVIETASAFEKTGIMLNRLMGSAGAGKEAFNWILDLSTKAPIGIDALQDSFIKLQVAGLDPMSGKLKTLVDAVAAFGGGSQELQRASVAIMQMAGKGVVSMEELRQQLGEVMPTAMKLMAREMGLTMAELSKKVADGAVDAATGLNALFKGLEKEYGGAASEMMNSFSGIITALGAEWKKFQNDIARAGAFDSIKDALKELLDWMKAAKDNGDMEQLAQNISRFFELIIGGAKLSVKALDGLTNALGRAIYGTGGWEMMQGAVKKHNKELADSKKWIKENEEFLANRARKYEEAEKVITGATQKEIDEIKKLREEWTKLQHDFEIDAMKSGMTEWEKKIFDVEIKFGELAFKARKLGESIVQVEDWKATQIEAINKEHFAHQVKDYQDYAEKLLTKQKKLAEDQIESLKTYREALLKTYDEAIKKADEYGNQVKKIDDLMAGGKDFLAGLKKEKMSPRERMESDRKALDEVLRVTGTAGTGLKEYEDALKGIEDFVGKYKKDLSSWDMSGLISQYEKILSTLELMRPNLEKAQNSWTAYATLAVNEIARIDQETHILQARIKEIDDTLSLVKEFKIDVTNANVARDSMVARLQVINLYTTTSVSGGTPGAAEVIYADNSGGVETYGNMPSLDRGGYIQKTGMILAHEGETVTPKGGGRGITVNLGGISIQGVNNPDEIARQMAKPLERELRRLGAIH